MKYTHLVFCSVRSDNGSWNSPPERQKGKAVIQSASSSIWPKVAPGPLTPPIFPDCTGLSEKLPKVAQAKATVKPLWPTADWNLQASARCCQVLPVQNRSAGPAWVSCLPTKCPQPWLWWLGYNVQHGYQEPTLLRWWFGGVGVQLRVALWVEHSLKGCPLYEVGSPLLQWCNCDKGGRNNWALKRNLRPAQPAHKAHSTVSTAK